MNIYAYVAKDANGKEGLVGVQLSPELFLPFVAHELEKAKMYATAIKQMVAETMTEVSLINFSSQEVVDTFAPPSLIITEDKKC